MKVGKPTSKRTPVRLRHKIEKASAAKQRKARKEAKKNPQWRSRLKKDPGIPNLFPYKDKLLHEIEEGKMRKEEEQRRRKEEAKARREGGAAAAASPEEADAEEEDDEELVDYDSEENEDEDVMQDVDDANPSNPMAALLASARQRAQDFSHAAEPDLDEVSDASADSWTGFGASSSKPQRTTKTDRRTGASSSQSHTTAFNNLLSSSDILLYILDARDPVTTRSQQIERQITSDPSKRLFLILNKIDLVPPTALKAWLKHLRRSYLILPLISSSAPTNQSYARDHARSGLTPQTTTSALLHALKARSTATTTAQNAKASGITVGILGHPNTGKSTIINSLLGTSHQHANKRSKTSAPTGAEAGVTNALRSIKLDSKLRLLDAPGIVFPFDAPLNVSTGPTPSKTQRESEKTARLTLLNAIPSHQVSDPMPAVNLLLSRAAAGTNSADESSSAAVLSQSLAEAYNIPGGALAGTRDMTTQFLIAVARARGRLGKGGAPNLPSAGKTVLGDWWAGRIRGGWLELPHTAAVNGTDQRAGKESNADDKKVVTEWAEEFKLDGIWGDDAFNEQNAGEDVMHE